MLESQQTQVPITHLATAIALCAHSSLADAHRRPEGFMLNQFNWLSNICLTSKREISQYTSSSSKARTRNQTAASSPRVMANATTSKDNTETCITSKRDRDRFVVHTLGGHKIEGISIGGQETSIVLPSLKIAFDSGRCPQRCVYADVMCLSHTHMDHVGGAGMYVATRSLLNLEPPTILLPRARVEAFGAFISSLRALDDSALEHDAVGIAPGERYRMSKLFEIAPFVTMHPVPSQGYIVYGTKNKLKAQYAGFDGQEIKRLRESGEEISDKIEVPEVAFTGDTTGEWIDNPSNVDALKAKLLIMECTFIDDSVSKTDAASFGHTHIDDIIARAEKFENEAILLIHFSARYKAEQIKDALHEKLPPSLRQRCTPLLVGYE